MRGTVVVIVVFVATGSRHPPNQPHLRQVVVEVVMVSVVNAEEADVVVLSSYRNLISEKTLSTKIDG